MIFMRVEVEEALKNAGINFEDEDRSRSFTLLSVDAVTGFLIGAWTVYALMLISAIAASALIGATIGMALVMAINAWTEGPIE